MSAAIAQAVRLAYPDHRAKRMARELDCSVITAKRIAASGEVSGRLRPALVKALLSNFETMRAWLDRIEDELRLVEYQERMVARVARRRPVGDASAPLVAAKAGEASAVDPAVAPRRLRGDA